MHARRARRSDSVGGQADAAKVAGIVTSSAARDEFVTRYGTPGTTEYGILLYAVGVTAFAWQAASQRTLEVIEPWRHHWDLTFWILESSAKLAWAAAAALLSVLVKPNRANMVLLPLCVLLWLVHFSIHIGLIT